MLSWDDLRTFLAISRAGSLAGAARALRVDATTVGRRLDALEHELQSTLFVRRRDGYALTPAGTRLMPAAERAEAAAIEALRAVAASDDTPGGRVRVTLLDEIATAVVIPTLGRLRERWPRVRVDLLATARKLDLTRGEADLALRFGRPTEPELIATRVARVQERAYASQSWLASRGLDADGVDHLDRREVVLLLSGERETWTEGLGEVIPSFRATSPAGTYAAIAGGLGVGLVPDLLAARDPRLVPLPKLPVVREHTLWLVSLPSALSVPAVRVVADHLTEVLRAFKG